MSCKPDAGELTSRKHLLFPRKEKLVRYHFVVCSLLTVGMFLSVAAQDAAKARTWEGNWNNRKYGTSGPLRCVATATSNTNWDARFDGTGLGKPFRYDVSFTGTTKGDRTLLQGTANVGGDTYRWTGSIKGDVLQGSYRSSSGNNGEFVLKEVKEKPGASARPRTR